MTAVSAMNVDHRYPTIVAASAVLVWTVMVGPAAAQDVDIAARAAYTESPTVDREGNVYFCESGSERILKMDTKGVISSYRDKFRCSGLLVDPEQRMIMLGQD